MMIKSNAKIECGESNTGMENDDFFFFFDVKIAFDHEV